MKPESALIVSTAALMTLALAAPLEAQRRCDVRDVQELTLDAAGLDMLDLDAGSGQLVVEGRNGTRSVRVTATLCASSEELLDGLEVSLTERGSTALLETDYPEHRGGWGNRYASIHLEVEVPYGMDARIVDGSGSAELQGLGNVDVQDGSGELTISDLTGDLRLDDGSGEVDIRGVRGSVEVDDGSGELTIRDIGGRVVVDDGSGSVRIEGVAQDVDILSGGSGQVEVSDVDGDLTVENTRRSRIRYDNVRGELDLPAERRRGRRGGDA